MQRENLRGTGKFECLMLATNRLNGRFPLTASLHPICDIAGGRSGITPEGLVCLQVRALRERALMVQGVTDTVDQVGCGRCRAVVIPYFW
jgi:hypothetical protein